MVYLVLAIVIVSIIDIKGLITQNNMKDLFVYAVIMLLVAAYGIFYFSNPERDSIAKILLTLIGKEG